MAVSKVILNGETLIDVTQKTVTPSNMLSGITALKNDGTDITGSIATKSAADLITSGSQVTVPSGMYGTAAVALIPSAARQSQLDVLATPQLSVSNNGLIQAQVANVGIRYPISGSGYIDTDYQVEIYSSGSSSYQLPTRTAADLSASGSVVTVPSGWYAAAATTAIAAGWISLALGSTEIPIDSGRFSIDDQTGIIYVNNGVTLTQVPPFIPGYISDVGYLELDVEATGSYQLPVKTASDLSAAGSVVTVPSGYYTIDVSKAVASGSINLNLYSQIDLDSDSFNINPNTGVVYVNDGVISTGRPGFSSGYISDPGYYMIEASASGSYALPTWEGTTFIPSEESMIVTPSNVYTLGNTVIAAIPSSYVGSAIARRSAADLTAAGSVVSAPSGYYEAGVSKAIASGTLNEYTFLPSIKPTWSLNSSTGTINAQYEVAPGIQPIASSGYFETGEYIYPMITMDSSYQLPTKAAATIVPSTADQVVASGYFLTGAQTIKGDSALIPSNIAAGVSIFGIEGTHQGGGNYQAKTVLPSASTQVILPDSEGFYDLVASGAEPISSSDDTTKSFQFLTVNGVAPVENNYYHLNGTFKMMMGDTSYGTISINVTKKCEYDEYLGPLCVSVYPEDVTTTGYGSALQWMTWMDGGDGKPFLWFCFDRSSISASTPIPDGDFNIYDVGVSYDALSSVTVVGAPLQSKTVTPSTEQQIITPDTVSILVTLAAGSQTSMTYGDATFPFDATGVEDTTYYFKGKINLGTYIIDGETVTWVVNIDGTAIYTNGRANLSSISTTNVSSWHGDGIEWQGGTGLLLSFNTSTTANSIEISEDFTISTGSVDYYGLSQVIVQPIATTSYYLTQDSQGYITYSSIMPSGGEYYIFDVAGIKHIEGN